VVLEHGRERPHQGVPVLLDELAHAAGLGGVLLQIELPVDPVSPRIVLVLLAQPVGVDAVDGDIFGVGEDGVLEVLFGRHLGTPKVKSPR
jgi:hypothetical protein